MAAAANTGVAADAPHMYHMGLNTLRVDRQRLHGGTRSKFIEAFKQALAADNEGAAQRAGVVLLQGGEGFPVYSTDGELVFRQEGYMHYLFGVTEEGWYGAMDLHTGKAHLFMPRLPESYAVWMGRLKAPQEYQAIYAVDAVHYVDKLPAVLKQLLAAGGTQQQGAKPGPLYVLQGKNSDSGREVPGASFDGMAEFHTDTRNSSTLFNVLTECRVHKSAEEVEVQRYVNRVGAAGHVAIMRAAAAGMMEYQLESLFLHTCYSTGGCRLPGYTPISASGPNGAVLHYGHAGAPNDRQIQAGEMLLVDMGCEYYRYTSDITCTWPVGGRFTPAQRLIYETVLAAHQAVIAAMKPGVPWPDMHRLAYQVLLQGLKEGGLLTGEVQAMMDADVGALFMPHGLGHFLGIDTHDVGGYLPGTPPRSHRPGFKSLRTARKLEAGMVITVEPGCYFNEALLGPALQDPAHSQFLVRDKVLGYLQFGGVRLEDNVLVTDTGAESLTHVPRTVDEIEAVMAGAPWPADLRN